MFFLYIKKNQWIGLLGILLIGFLFCQGAHAITATETLSNSKIYGYYPYFNSLGTRFYRAGTEGNRGVIDNEGNRYPTVGSIIGFDDETCALATHARAQDSSRSIQPSSDKTGTRQTAEPTNRLYHYVDLDFDPCRILTSEGNDAQHDVKWFMLDTQGKSIDEMTSFDEFEAIEITNEAFANSIISPGTEVEIEDELIGNYRLPISGKYTSSLRVPNEAVGKYIGVIYTPSSQYGLPNFGKPLKMWDLRYFYQQTPPSMTGLLPFEQNDGQKTVINDFIEGSGGGIVQPPDVQPEIQNLTLSGILAGGRTVTLDYEFIPNVTTPYTDETVFVWGALDQTLSFAALYDETLSFEENQALMPEAISLSKGKRFDVNVNNVGEIVELTAIPIRLDEARRYGVVGPLKRHDLNEFSSTLTPLIKPEITELTITGTPVLNGALNATYRFKRSNSVRNTDASLYRWSYQTLLEEDIELASGVISRLPNTDYNRPLPVPTSPQLTADAMTGRLIRLTVDAIDVDGVHGNQQIADVDVSINTANGFKGIKLVYGDYEGHYPSEKVQGYFPVLGFKGATFQLFAENFDPQTNFDNWQWSSSHRAYARVDNYGQVTLLSDMALGQKITISAVNRNDPTKILNQTFTLMMWLYSNAELIPSHTLMTYSEAKAVCDKRTIPGRIFLQVPTYQTITGATVDPVNPNQSKNPSTDEEARRFVYTFPNFSYYSHWGNLANYPAVSDTGAVLNRKAFPDGGIPYIWAEAINNPVATSPRMYIGMTGLGNWFRTSNLQSKYNVACMRLMNNPGVEPPLPPLEVPKPEPINNPMRAIKLPYIGYPANSRGFPTTHLYGQGFPSLGFTGAEFILFAEDLPDSAFARANNRINNRKWTWRVDNQPVAVAGIPSKNQYVQVSNEGVVMLLQRPPKDVVISINATNNANAEIREHTFSIDKWLLTPKQISSVNAMSRPNAMSACAARNARLPAVNEYTSVPMSPTNSEASQGSGTRAPGWNTIYTYPSTSFYSQWGQLNIYKEYNPITGALISPIAFPTGLYYWTSSQSQLGRAIFAGPAGWGDWASDANVNHLRSVACIVD
ncbi:hypothetical protein [Thorsellia anophelis]|uniref:Uncharacterized protein n=1 Tax=Thorsellia anophelis DSM 18579 TaxID=1123402 RepID=A0A1I0C9B1_9GAMM|nr:hypothetical protein [Thorsellia anophelis]SET16152.1 hypothetical protein SAMN02583745_01534 [Thorsellia anophelis DSM 18579]